MPCCKRCRGDCLKGTYLTSSWGLPWVRLPATVLRDQTEQEIEYWKRWQGQKCSMTVCFSSSCSLESKIIKKGLDLYSSENSNDICLFVQGKWRFPRESINMLWSLWLLNPICLWQQLIRASSKSYTKVMVSKLYFLKKCLFSIFCFTWQIWQTNNSFESNIPNRIMTKHRCCAWVW